jgi:hypothetical protein
MLHATGACSQQFEQLSFSGNVNKKKPEIITFPASVNEKFISSHFKLAPAPTLGYSEGFGLL